MKDRTLCFLVRGNPPHKVLLGFKKAGFGTGKFTGFGGAVEEGETVQAATIRELEEETSIQVLEKALKPIARLTFQFPSKPHWSQIVHVFLAESWGASQRKVMR